MWPPRRGGVYLKYRLTSSMRMRRHLLRSLTGSGETPAAFGYDILAGFHPRPDVPGSDMSNNSARRGRAAGSSRTPTPTGLRETYAGAETVGSAKPSRRAGMEPRPYGNAGGTISDPPVGVGVLDDPPSRHAPTPRSRTTPNNAQNRRGGDGTPLLHEIQTPKAFHRFPRDCWRRCGLFPHRRRQSIFQINAALRAAATLFPSSGKSANAVYFSAASLPRPNVG